MIHILYTDVNDTLSDKKWMEYFNLLPVKMQKILMSYQFETDRYFYLFGRLLLINGFKHFCTEPQLLEKIKLNESGRPFLDKKYQINFNISHSGKVVICAFSDKTVLGIDIEKIKTIDNDIMRSTMTNAEWIKIQNAKDPNHFFLKLWTKKESLVKTGIIDLDDIEKTEVLNNFIKLHNKTLYFNQIQIDKNHICHICSDNKNAQFKITHLNFF